jgi:hypothetical protein
VAATVARLISYGGTVKTGVHFLTEAVDPVAFMQELRKIGVSQMESFSATGGDLAAQGAPP